MQAGTVQRSGIITLRRFLSCAAASALSVAWLIACERDAKALPPSNATWPARTTVASAAISSAGSLAMAITTLRGAQ